MSRYCVFTQPTIWWKNEKILVSVFFSEFENSDNVIGGCPAIERLSKFQSTLTSHGDILEHSLTLDGEGGQWWVGSSLRSHSSSWTNCFSVCVKIVVCGWSDSWAVNLSPPSNSGDSKGGLDGPWLPQIFAWPPPSFFLNFPFKFVWLTYVGLPHAFCKNTGHFVNSARSKLCRNS